MVLKQLWDLTTLADTDDVGALEAAAVVMMMMVEVTGRAFGSQGLVRQKHVGAAQRRVHAQR